MKKMKVLFVMMYLFLGMHANSQSTVYEAENGTRNGSAAVKDVANASNGKVVSDFTNINSFSKVINVDGGTGGKANLTITYANGNAVDGELTLHVGGVAQHKVLFPPTGNWTTFADITMEVTLVAGPGTTTTNAIKMQRVDYAPNPADVGGVDIDKYTVTAIVNVPVTGVTVTPSSTIMAIGATSSLTSTVAPSDATNKTLTWSSSNTAVATVSASGVVTGVSTGNVTITVTTADGNLTATSVIDVVASTTKVYEAENGTRNGSAAVKDVTNASNGKVVSDFTNINSFSKVINVDGGTGGKASLTITYANGNAVDGELTLHVGGVAQHKVLFPPTGSWTTFADITMDVTLIAGPGTTTTNAIKMQRVDYTPNPADVGGVDIDKYSVTTLVIIPVTGVTVNPTSTKIAKGETTTITPTIAPVDATNKAVNWSSSDTSVATVSNTGIVTAVSNGTAILTVTSQDGSKTATTSVTVSNDSNKIYEAENGTLNAGASVKDVANASNGKVVTNFSTLNAFSKIPNVDGLTGGPATLTIRYANGNSDNRSISLHINGTFIKQITFPSTGGWDTFADVTTTVDLISGTGNAIKLQRLADDVAGVDIDKYTVTIAEKVNVLATELTIPATGTITEIGGTTSLTAIISPANATTKALTWSSSNPKVATVSATGVVTAITNGTTILTATTTDGSNLTATSIITVNAIFLVSGITLPPTVTLKTFGAISTIKATIAPVNATNQILTWVSSNPAIATVSATGVVTAVSNGSTVITATSTDGTNQSATCTVTVSVKIQVTSVTIPATANLSKLGETNALTVLVAPNNATNQNLNWSSSDMAVATVSTIGVVTAISNGTATITASAIDGSDKTATCLVTVSTIISAIHSIPSEFGSVSIYPNPAVNKATIELKGFNDTELFNISIFDIAGKLMYNKLNAPNKLISIQFDNRFKSGVYFVKVQENKEVITQKLIINAN